MHRLIKRPAPKLAGMMLAALLGTSGAFSDEQVKTCGGRYGERCPADQFCDSVAGICNGVDPPGFCMPKPEACTREYLPVCGCDGKTYGNDCERRAAGASKLKDGECTG